MKRVTVRILLHCVLPLLIGFLIYYCYRPDVAIIQWITDRQPLIPLQELNSYQRIFIYSGPDFCWSYSLASALFIWESGLSKTVRFFPVVVLLLLLLSELLQARMQHQFTFDWYDLGAALFAFILSFTITYRRHE